MLAITVALVMAPPYSFSQGTLAGTNIQNMASVNYTVDSSSFTMTSLPVNITVAELVNVNLLWQDAGSVKVSSGASAQVLTFLATNTGNGNETFDLSANSTLGTADFNPLLSGIYFDSNNNDVYDAGTDVQYIAGLNEPTLSPDGAITLFLMNDIPLSLNDGDAGNSELTIASQTGTGPAGTLIAGGGDGGLIDAVIGTSTGRAGATGSYLVSTVDVLINKTAIVTDEAGGSSAMTGSTISYNLSITVTGTGTVTGLVIRDLIPANTSYKANTLRLNGSALTDAGDSDEGDVGVSAANTVTVTLGNVTGGTAAQNITFDVTIN